MHAPNMKYLYLLLLCCFMSSCEFFHMEERTASDVILEEELHTINWHEVDSYPVFNECNAVIDSERLACFTESLHTKVLHGMQRFALTNELDSIVKLDLLITIDATKNLRFSAKLDSTAFSSLTNFALLKKYIQEGLDSLVVVEPAFKRGIPVTTEFELPIIFIQENE